MENGANCWATKRLYLDNGGILRRVPCYLNNFADSRASLGRRRAGRLVILNVGRHDRPSPLLVVHGVHHGQSLADAHGERGEQHRQAHERDERDQGAQVMGPHPKRAAAERRGEKTSVSDEQIAAPDNRDSAQLGQTIRGASRMAGQVKPGTADQFKHRVRGA